MTTSLLIVNAAFLAIFVCIQVYWIAAVVGIVRRIRASRRG